MELADPEQGSSEADRSSLNTENGKRNTSEEQPVPANRTLALVLRTIEVFETSLVTTLFTRELGKVAALAKGCAAAEVAVPGWP